MNHTRLITEIAGWYGATAIVSAYVLVSFNLLPSDSIAYQLLNLTGALGIAAISIVKRVTQSIALNLFWAVIAGVALVNIII